MLIWYGNCYDYFYLKSNLKFFKSYNPIATIEEEKIITKKLETPTVEGNVVKLQVIYDDVTIDKKNQEIVKIEELRDIKLSQENHEANGLQIAETSNESLKDETENFDKKDGEQNLIAKSEVLTKENEGQENLAIVTENVGTSYKLGMIEEINEKNSIYESADIILKKIYNPIIQ